MFDTSISKMFCVWSYVLENINFPDLISYSCDSAEEACELYNYYNQNPVTEETKNEETISENLQLV